MTAAPHPPAHPSANHATHAPTAQDATPGALGPYRHEKTLFIILASIAALFWLALTAATIGIVWIYLLIAYAFSRFSHSGLIAHLKGSAVRIDGEQFPELHARLLACCQRIGIATPPEAYLRAGHGLLNAYATRFLRRYYVVLESDIVGALKDDPEGINFYLGHELCHVARSHLSNGWWLAPALVLPLLGTAYRRAQEYTCDQYGLACCQHPVAAQHALAVLAAGSSQWKTLRAEGYLKQCAATGGFWMALNELAGDYPWLCKRMRHVMPQTPVDMPRRNPFAWMIAAFLPRIGASGLVGGLVAALALAAVLATVAVAAYQDAAMRAQLAPVFGYGDDLTARLTRYYDERKELPADLGAIGAQPKTSGLPVDDTTFDQDSGELQFTLPGGRVIVFTPALDDQGRLIWSCATNLPRAVVPADTDCRNVGTSAADRLGSLLDQAH